VAFDYLLKEIALAKDASPNVVQIYRTRDNVANGCEFQFNKRQVLNNNTTTTTIIHHQTNQPDG
jgi:hypothetical protein